MTPAEVKARLAAADGEIALLDVRERGAHARGHPLFAASLPLSRIELDIDRLAPCRAAPLVLLDDGGGDDRARRAAERLAGFGYADIALLDDGIAGWRAAGEELFDGVSVPSKAFGEYVELHCHTPHVTAPELARLKADGARIVILDSRPLEEYRRMSIPGGIDVPGAELVHRVRDLAPDPDTLVVVNCAGRTRSIIGAQSLINAGLPNTVVALENGTMGWALAGYELEHGREHAAPPPSADARRWARAAAARVTERFRVPRIDRAALARWQDEGARRTLYLCDVRTAEEYQAGHLPGARHAPGGQLVQASDSFIPVYGARVVLVDDDEVRAAMTASWLIQMGRREVHVLAGGIGADGLEPGPEPRTVLGLTPARQAFEISVGRMMGMLPGRDMTLIDFADSRSFKAGHVAGAWWTVRARLAETIARMPQSQMVVATSPNSDLAHLAAPEVARHVRCPVRVLGGGTDAWVAAGLPLEAGDARMLGDQDDIHLLPYDHPPAEVEAAMRAYLSWETALVPRTARDGVARFDVRPRA